MNNLNTARLLMIGVLVFVLAISILFCYHPILNSVNFVEDVFKYVTKVLPYRIFGLFGLLLGALFLWSGARIFSRSQVGVTDGK